MMLRFERLDPRTFDFRRLEVFEDRTVQQTPEWFAFVRATQGARPVVASLSDGGETVGYFTALAVRKYGVKVLGSPFPGWTTSYMGFNLFPWYRRRKALEGLRSFAFKTFGCSHVEVFDRHVTEEDAHAAGYDYRLVRGYEIDLRRDADDLFNRMDQERRRGVRRAEEYGVTIEEARDPGFADDYYAQLQDVFAQRSLAPTYKISRVKALIEHVHPTGNLLLLRARDKEGRCIATGLFPALGRRMLFWGAASWREHQHLHADEALIWRAMLYWKARGVSFFDMGAGGDDKRLYGGDPIAVPWMRASRFGAVSTLRDVAKTVVDLKQRVFGLRRR